MFRPCWSAGENTTGSNSLELADSPFVNDIPGVQSGLWLQQNNMNFLVRHRHMLDAMRDDDKFAFADNCFMSAKLHSKRSFDDQEQFVFAVVMMPDELAFQFDRLYSEIVDLAENARMEVILKLREFVHQIHRMHGPPYNSWMAASVARKTCPVVSGLVVSE